jgi:hypothetical protein
LIHRSNYTVFERKRQSAPLPASPPLAFLALWLILWKYFMNAEQRYKKSARHPCPSEKKCLSPFAFPKAKAYQVRQIRDLIVKYRLEAKNE